MFQIKVSTKPRIGEDIRTQHTKKSQEPKNQNESDYRQDKSKLPTQKKKT